MFQLLTIGFRTSSQDAEVLRGGVPRSGSAPLGVLSLAATRRAMSLASLVRMWKGLVQKAANIALTAVVATLAIAEPNVGQVGRDLATAG